MKRLLTVFALSGMLFSCGSNGASEETEEAASIEVLHFGALKDMMHKGDLSAKAQLADLKDMEHVYAIGAMENLKGEIQIYDGQSFNTCVADSAVEFDKDLAGGAALLVYAVVPEWKDVAVPSSVKTYADLEKFVAEQAKENGIDITKPFPFRVEGTPVSFDWHVINWPEGDTEHSHQKHVESGLHGTIENTPVELLGFYSDKHHRIFTHHTTNMHVHVKTNDGTLAGHMDDVVCGEGMVLKLPK